jgi:hypothetical protein
MKLASLLAAIASTEFLAAVARAHPGHSALDALAGPPHAGHEMELLVFCVAASAVLAAAVRAWKEARG